MDIAITILSILHVLIAVLLVLIIMLQRPRQEGLGASFGGDMLGQLAGAQTTNVLQKGTAYITVLFFLNTIVIAWLMAHRTKQANDSKLLLKPAVTAPVPTPPATPPTTVTSPPVEVPAAPAPATPPAATPAPAPTTEGNSAPAPAPAPAEGEKPASSEKP